MNQIKMRSVPLFYEFSIPQLENKSMYFIPHAEMLFSWGSLGSKFEDGWKLLIYYNAESDLVIFLPLAPQDRFFMSISIARFDDQDLFSKTEGYNYFFIEQAGKDLSQKIKEFFSAVYNEPALKILELYWLEFNEKVQEFDNRFNWNGKHFNFGEKEMNFIFHNMKVLVFCNTDDVNLNKRSLVSIVFN